MVNPTDNCVTQMSGLVAIGQDVQSVSGDDITIGTAPKIEEEQSKAPDGIYRLESFKRFNSICILMGWSYYVRNQQIGKGMLETVGISHYAGDRHRAVAEKTLYLPEVTDAVEAFDTLLKLLLKETSMDLIPLEQE